MILFCLLCMCDICFFFEKLMVIGEVGVAMDHAAVPAEGARKQK